MDELKIKEFKKTVKRVYDKRNHKIKNSNGVYDAYKYIRKNGWWDIGRPLKEKEFYAIIRSINLVLADQLGQGKAVKLPQRMGTLEVRKRIATNTFKDGKLVSYYPVDWNRTLELWAEDEEARSDKTLIRIENQDVYQVYYNRIRANYNNKTYYEFKPNREIKHSITANVKADSFDSYLLY